MIVAIKNCNVANIVLKRLEAKYPDWHFYSAFSPKGIEIHCKENNSESLWDRIKDEVIGLYQDGIDEPMR
jgi:hypothetical protein